MNHVPQPFRVSHGNRLIKAVELLHLFERVRRNFGAELAKRAAAAAFLSHGHFVGHDLALDGPSGD